MSDEDAESGKVVRSRSYGGEVSASAGGNRVFSLEAGLFVEGSTRDKSTRGSRLAVLGHGDHEALAHPSPGGLSDAGARLSQANGIDPGGDATIAEARRVGEARVAAAIVRAGYEARTAGGRAAGDATVARSVLPPLRLNNGTLVLGERLGLRSSPLDPEGFDENGVHEKGHSSAVRKTHDQNRRNRESLEEWAATARKKGRVDSPVADLPEPSKRQRRTPGEHHITDESNGGNNNKKNTRDDPALLTLHDLKSARSRAHKAIIANNFTETLDLCQKILQEWPSDGATLLYQGAAMAQSGSWDNAWNRMERVLALSNGVEETATISAPAKADCCFTHADDRRGNAQSSARHVDAAEAPRATAAATVPPDIALAAAANLASFARARAPKTLDSNAETFFLIEGLRGAAERDRVAYERQNTSWKPALFSSETRSLDEKSTEELSGGKAEGSYEAGRIGGYTDLLVMMAQALKGNGQLISALRLYQRAILLGGHRDPRALHGIGGLSRRLLEVEHERTRRKSAILGTAAPTQSSVLLPASLPLPIPPTHDRHHLLSHQTGTSATAVSTSETGVASSRKQRPQQPTSGCEWGILHPKPGQVFSPDNPIQVEFDLTLLDPGLPSAGSLFETVAVGVGGVGADAGAGSGGLSSEDFAHESRGGGITVVEDGLGVVVCSYLEGYNAAHCLPRGQLRDIGLGWHTLTAEAYQLPSLRPFACQADVDAAGDSRVEHRYGRVITADRKPPSCSESHVREP